MRDDGPPGRVQPVSERARLVDAATTGGTGSLPVDDGGFGARSGRVGDLDGVTWQRNLTCFNRQLWVVKWQTTT